MRVDRDTGGAGDAAVREPVNVGPHPDSDDQMVGGYGAPCGQPQVTDRAVGANPRDRAIGEDLDSLRLVQAREPPPELSSHQGRKRSGSRLDHRHLGS